MAKAELTAVIEPGCRRLAEEMGFELVEVALDREPTGKYLRIYIDKPEGITLDDCERYHRAVLPSVEHYDYDFMEVSSPGIDRPLKTDRDFERNLGTEVEVHLFRALNGRKILNGTLAGRQEGDILLETEGGSVRIPGAAVSLVRPIVDMEGIEDVDLSDNAGTQESAEE